MNRVCRFLFVFVLGSFASRDVVAQQTAMALPPSYPLAEDVASPQSIVTASYDVLIRAPRQPFQWDRYRTLFLPEAIMIPSLEQVNGVSRVLSSEGFIDWVDDYYEQNAPIDRPDDPGFVEEEVHNIIHCYGDICQVMSTYQKRYFEQDEIIGRGINSFQLLFRDDRWWIVSVIWDEEYGAGPIPAKYLGK